MLVEIKVPEVGESISEGVIVEWFKANGARVERDEALFELETDKITMQVQSEAAGVLAIAVQAGDVKVGQVVGTVDTAAIVDSSSVAPVAAAPAPSAAAAPDAGRSAAKVEVAASDVPSPSGGAEDTSPRYPLSPAVRRLSAEAAVDPATLSGSGKGGRITKGDVIEAIAVRQAGGPASGNGAATPSLEDVDGLAAAAGDARNALVDALNVGRTTAFLPPPITHGARPLAAASAALDSPHVGVPFGTSRAASSRETRTRMTSLRKRLAQRLVDVQQNAAILTTFNEVDMGAAMGLRARYKQSFLERHGVKLGFMSLFVKAVVEALRSVPGVNARIDGEEIVQNHFYDIGVAVGTERGLVVPVVRDADTLSFAAIERQIADFALRARERKLELAELTGGCFTISNGGVYGSLVSTPILNPPQSAILGMHAIKKRPMVVGSDDRIEARPMMYLALSYDHRLVDGLEAVTFLKRIVECIEAPERLIFEV